MIVRLGIDLGGTFIKAGIIDKRAKILASLKYPTDAEKGADTVVKNLNIVYGKLLDICRKAKHEPASIGIGSPGTIHQPDGKVTDATPNIKGWRGLTLTRVFGKTAIPVYADNDANVVALAEYLVDFQAKYRDMIFITVGTGIGGGLIIDGKLHRGSTFAAAEIGHMSISKNGRLCKCGLRGCLETYASVPNMMKRAKYWASKLGDKIDQDITPHELFSQYKKGKRFAKMTIEENAGYLGVGIGSLVNVLNPEIVVIGGGFSGTGSEYIRLISKAIEQHAFKAATSRLKVVKARMGNNAGFVGAALLGVIGNDGEIERKRR